MDGSRISWARGRRLGRGSTASVYLAASTSGDPGSLFAVKSAELSRSAPLQREKKILSSLRSPHLVSCLGSDVTTESDGRAVYNLFLEYVPGGSLAEASKQQGGLDERAIRVYARGILHGLAYLHKRGIVHGDVKGQNVLLAGDHRAVKVADFGCARYADGGGDEVVGGTPTYMAPEVARGEEQGPAADIWALGCTVIEMATGRPPWCDVAADPVAALHRIAFSGDVPMFPPDASDDARDFLERCLSRDPRRRWTAPELLNHPFSKSCEEFPADRSPKSILDHDFWESWPGEEEGDEDESEPYDHDPRGAQERLRRLVSGAASPSPAVRTTWEDSCWLTVRDGTANEGSCRRRCSVSSNVQAPAPFDDQLSKFCSRDCFIY